MNGNSAVLAVTRFMRTAHVYSAAPALVLMFFFAVTGLYLNHPDVSDGAVTTQQRTLTLPNWAEGPWSEGGPSSAVVLGLLQWLDSDHNLAGVDLSVDYEADENLLVVDMAGPDGNALVEVFFDTAEVFVEQRSLSMLATFNNLHRAKHVNGFWVILSDLSALSMIIFCVSGLWLMLTNRLERAQASALVIVGSALFGFAAMVLH
ncbi:MAG: PepSY-associated TM helix domain-containing protein [Pseudomonadota bacterium]